MSRLAPNVKMPVSKQKKNTPRPDPQDLLAWYDKNRRDLPWRAKAGCAANPYHVWLSEIMLQQTTVVTVKPYFEKFINRWPTLKKLAAADEAEILTQWAGLGYYRRARMLYRCAQEVMRQYKGQFPSDQKELRALPGIGDYTAAAIASIAFDRHANVVDGNVERVVSRIFAVQDPMPTSKNEVRHQAAGLLPSDRYGDYAQALMDLGATVCTPRNPKCDLCPWAVTCIGRRLGVAEALPRKMPKAAKPVRMTTAFVLLNNKGQILLRRRPDQGLLAGMMEVPSSAWIDDADHAVTDVRHEAPVDAEWGVVPGQVRHIFTHFELRVTILIARKSCGGVPESKWVALDHLGDEALPSLMHKIIRHAIPDQGIE